MEEAEAEGRGGARVGKRAVDWDLNEWSWDGDLFIATTPSQHQQQQDPPASASHRKPPTPGVSVSVSVCQVHNCLSDLSLAKDYHRRHKVCHLHSKSTSALVNNLLQRFCQQCSRFHLLHEFDQGKRSCRRRLAGHNKRRRKTQPLPVLLPHHTTTTNTNHLLLITLLKLLSTMHFNNTSPQSNDQDLLAQLLTSLSNPSADSISALLHHSQILLNPTTPNDIPRDGLHPVDSTSVELQAASPQSPFSVFPVKDSPPAAYSDTSAPLKKLNNFDLNDIFVDSDDGTEDLERSPTTDNYATGSTDYPPWPQHDSQHSSLPQNSDSQQSSPPSSSSGEALSRTDRIVFKLFGKEPSEFPMVLRGQILDWLAHSPTDIESYIRPGCIILTVYLRLAEPLWDEICSDLSSSLTRLFDQYDDSFWSTGWVFSRVQNQIALVHNGQVLLDSPLSLESSNCSRILSVIPVAVSVGEQTQFHVRGCNLSRSETKLLCALEGKYLDQEAKTDLGEDGDVDESDIQNAKLTCSIPNMVGRGFIEVEDHGLSSSFFPFIVAEKDVCSDIRRLESVLELKETTEETYDFNENSEAKRQAMDFLNEMGWLLHRIQLKSRLAHLDPNTTIFSFKRFRWLMDFSIDHDWCAVVKKLLDIWVTGSVGYGDHPSSKLALSEMGLLHRAVRKNSRSMVELLLGYIPTTRVEEFKSTIDGDETHLFTPDAQGPGGLTPLHVAAGRDGAEEILDALTDDPREIGVEAWKNAQDSTGATPEDYARLRGHYAYIHLVQRKIKRRPVSGQVVIDIPRDDSLAEKGKKQAGAGSFEIARSGSLALNQSCKLCFGKTMKYGNGRTSMVYRPAMLSMVAIAAVCVCVALLFKSMPTVVCLFQPFRWESLNYGSS